MTSLRYGAPLILLILLAVLLLASPSASSRDALAAPAMQTTPEAPAGDEPVWSTPLNLSQSGAAFDPAMVADASGTIHALWQESGVASLLYARRTEAGWSDPAAVEFPFGTRTYYPGLAADEEAPLFTPQLMSTTDGRIHAFWTDEEETLFHSSVDGEGFQEFSAWTERRLVTDGVVQIDVAAGNDDALHLAYVRGAATAELPAGIYYQNSADGGTSWLAPELLYASGYFRNSSGNNAHVRVSAGADNGVYVAWDSAPREKVFLARSPDEGQSWDEPLVVDARQPEDAIEGEGPGEILVANTAETAHVIWRASHETAFCNLYHQWSADGGENWESAPEPVMQLGVCPEQSELFAVGDLLLLLLRGEAQSYLLLWNGEQWSEPEVQEPLMGFTSPETFRPVEFNWYGATVSTGNQLLVLGRGGGEQADVWVMSRPLGAVEDWFPPPSPWGEPTTVGVSQAPRDGLTLVADVAGFAHAFWSQPLLTEEGEVSEREAIYYARRADGRWSQPFPILTPASGEVLQLDVALSPDGRLFVFWTEAAGQIYYSRASALEAQTPTEWAEPRILPGVHQAARSPSAAFDEAGQLFVAYAVSLNEARGIHLIRSGDVGATWSDSVTIFDAVTAEWPMVDRPTLQAVRGGGLHVVWTQFSLPPDARPLSLHYSRSDDGGESWSESQLVMEGAVTWSALAGLGDRVLHRVWQVEDAEGSRFWYDMSPDGGRTWTRAERLAVFDVSGAASLASDGVSQLHLVHLSRSGLGHQRWDGELWADAGRVELGSSEERDQVAAALMTGEDGRLFTVYTGHLAEDAEEEDAFGLFAVDRAVESSDGVSTPPATLTPVATPEPVTGVTATTQPTPTPTVVLPAEGQGQQTLNIPGTGSTIGTLAVGLLPVALLVLAVILYGLRSTWFGRR